MKKALNYAANMAKDYCVMKFKTAAYEACELAKFVEKYTAGCAIIGGALLSAGIGLAIVNNCSEE